MPQFLNQQNKQRGKRKSLNEDEYMKNRSNPKKKVLFPIKQKINKKVFPTYPLKDKESKHAVPVNSLNKSRENSPKNRKFQIPQLMKEKPKNKV